MINNLIILDFSINFSTLDVSIFIFLSFQVPKVVSFHCELQMKIIFLLVTLFAVNANCGGIKTDVTFVLGSSFFKDGSLLAVPLIVIFFVLQNMQIAP